MELTYLGLGANLGTLEATIHSAIHRLRALPGVSSLRSSSLYRTAPISPIPQPDFINAVVEIWTSLSLDQLWEEMQKIEVELGKRPKSKDAPRPIDIDILLYGQTVCDGELQLPHPRMLERLFVLAPLTELSPFVYYRGKILVLQPLVDSLTNQEVALFSCSC